MTQPTFTEGPPVPLMIDGVVDSQTLQQLFQDLATSTTILGVNEKNAGCVYSKEERLSLDAICNKLLTGQTRAMQIRYNYADQEWTDTIFRLPTGFRIVRCRHDP